MPHPSSLQAKADPNILPPKQKPTTRSLAVTVGNQDLVEMLLEEAAEVHPQVDTVLMIAVLNEHKGNIQSMLRTEADPW